MIRILHNNRYQALVIMADDGKRLAEIPPRSSVRLNLYEIPSHARHLVESGYLTIKDRDAAPAKEPDPLVPKVRSGSSRRAQLR